MLLQISFKYRWLSSLMIMLVIAISFGFNSFTLAQESTNINAVVARTCQEELGFESAEIIADFYTDLESVAQNSQVVSEQINEIYERFSEAKSELNTAAIRAIDATTGRTDVTSSAFAQDSCFAVRDASIETARNVMRRFLNKVSATKRDLALTTQYRALITDSEQLLKEISTSKASFKDFVNRIPCIANSCAKN